MVKLYRIIKETNDIKDLNKKVNAWKKEYPIKDFMEMYKRRAKKYTSRKYLEENSFDTNKAFYDLCHTLNANATYDELKDKVKVWEKDYRIGEKFKVEDFKGKATEVKKMLDDEYLYSISKEDEKEDNLRERQASISIQTQSYKEFVSVIEKGNLAKVVEWIYKNRNIKFGDYYKGQIIAKTAFKFPVSLLENTTLKLNLNERGLTLYEYQTIDDSRRYIVTEFIKNLIKDKNNDTSGFQKAFNKSEKAKNRGISNHEMIEQDAEVVSTSGKQEVKLDANDINEIEDSITSKKTDETKKKEEQTSTFVIDLNADNKKEETKKLQVTELDAAPVITG